jgi:uncharacterized protein YbdZ (MbtH family)
MQIGAIMRKTIFVILWATLLLVQRAGASGTHIIDNYYTDATFTSACGWFDNNCTVPRGWDSDGYSTNYRYRETYDCTTSEQLSAACQEWNGTQWVDVACPDETVTADGRLHIPGG